MTDAKGKTEHSTAEHAGDDAGPDEQSASRDLADGLDLMLRAARKAMRGFDSRPLEELGRRAVATVETLDAAKVSELGRQAVKNLDPRKIEEVAQDAGRELMNVIERVTDRIDGLVSSRRRDRDRDDDDE